MTTTPDRRQTFLRPGDADVMGAFINLMNKPSSPIISSLATEIAYTTDVTDLDERMIEIEDEENNDGTVSAIPGGDVVMISSSSTTPPSAIPTVASRTRHARGKSGNNENAAPSTTSNLPSRRSRLDTWRVNKENAPTKTTTTTTTKTVLGQVKENVNVKRKVGEVVKPAITNAAAGPTKKRVLNRRSSQTLPASTSAMLTRRASVATKSPSEQSSTPRISSISEESDVEQTLMGPLQLCKAYYQWQSRVLREKLVKANEQVLCLQTQYDELKIEKEIAVSKYERESTEWNATRTSLEREQQRVEEEIKDVEIKLSTEQARSFQLQQELDELTKKHETTVQQLESELASTKEHLVHSQRETANEKQECQDLRTKLASYEATIQELQTQRVNDEIIRRKLHCMLQDLRGSIRVLCRIRPSNDIDENDTDIPTYTRNKSVHDGVASQEMLDVIAPTSMSVDGRYEKKVATSYGFDRVFPPSSTQSDLFDELSTLVTSSLDGYNVTVMAYGQTGSGKTYTMFGPTDTDTNESTSSATDDGMKKRRKWGQQPQAQAEIKTISTSNDSRGMIPRTVEQLFSTISDLRTRSWNYSIRMSMLELYNEEIRDLLATNDGNDNMKYKIQHDKSGRTVVTNLTIVDVSSPEQVHQLLQQAATQRSVGRTMCNAQSSRSHTVFQLYIEGNNPTQGDHVSSILSLVDLAGSERLDSSQASGTTLKETQCINASLSNLVGCISAIASKQAHIPFRNSQLTYLLKDSLGGKSKTLFFINISPDAPHYAETLCTLRFASKLRAVEFNSTSNPSSTISTSNNTNNATTTGTTVQTRQQKKK